jgi:4'-phosphopantetheinyl transferase EntD
MIEVILPKCVAAVDVRSERTPDLFSLEQRYICRAIQRRRREFSTARRCARDALASLGVPRQAIGVGPHGEPRWPVGVVGSITHCIGYRGSAVAMASNVVAIGIDAEPNNPLAPDLVATIARPDEIARLHRLASHQPEIQWDRLLFSAKESIYKALFPLIGHRLEFGDANIEIDPGGAFSARLIPPRPWEEMTPTHHLQGRWVASDGLLLTSTVIES